MALLVILVFLFIAILGIRTTEEDAEVAVSVASPPAEVAGCVIEPRPADEIARIAATPATPVPAVASPEALEPVDVATRHDLERVILLADICAQQGEFERLAALYSDHALQSGVLAEEGVPIEAGTPPATPTTGPPLKVGPPTVRAAWWIDETHVWAHIARGNSIREVRFVLENGAWLIDSGETVIDFGEGRATPDASRMLPLPVLQAIVHLIADETGASVQSITISSVERVDWPDTALGCPQPGEFYAQVITPGYRVMVEHEGQQFEVHTDLRGRAVTC
jgi:hypothetical protein